MCYFLTIASPLTLSEVRSMLPAGLTAHLVGTAEAAEFRRRLPSAQTVATLVVGACSCDLVHPGIRIPGRMSGSCGRATPGSSCPATRSSGSWSDIVAGRRRRRSPISDRGDVVAFAAEHARNAGPTLYNLRFGPGAKRPPLGETENVTRTVTEMRSNPDGWLPEGPVVRLVR